jgi:YVTN family beta-propeller protein
LFFEPGIVSVIATSTNTVVATVTVGNEAGHVAITPDGAFAYVTNGLSDDVSVIATSTNTVVATVTSGDGPGGVAITHDGAFAYVANHISNSVSVIATSTNTVAATVTVGNGPWGVAITPVTETCSFGQLSEAIDALGPLGDGTLNKGQMNALLVKVAQATDLTGKGKLAAATAVLDGLLQQIADLQAEGVLTAEQADDLSACASDVIAGL